MPRPRPVSLLAALLLLSIVPDSRAQKPPLTLDEFLNAVAINSVQISPDGHAVVIETLRVRVWDSTAELRYLVLPERPAGTEGMSEEVGSAGCRRRP